MPHMVSNNAKPIGVKKMRELMIKIRKIENQIKVMTQLIDKSFDVEHNTKMIEVAHSIISSHKKSLAEIGVIAI
jgi:hypothetical protein